MLRSVGRAIGGFACSSSRVSSGTELFDSIEVTLTPAAQSSTVQIARNAQITYTGTGGFDAVGHPIPVMGYFIMNAASQTVQLAFGTEGKIECQAGTITNAGSIRAGLADVAAGATVTTWTGLSSGISNVNGTLTNAKGADFSITAVTGSAISNGFAYNCQDITTAKVTNFAAFRSQVTAKTGHFCIYSDGNAQSVHAGNFRIGSTTAPTAALDVTGLVLTTASATGSAGLRLPHGAAPSSPVNGDIWTTTAGLYVRINGATVGPLS